VFVRLDAHPLLARTSHSLLLRDGLEEERADAFPAPRRLQVEHEDLAHAGADHAPASGADHRVVFDGGDPPVPALELSDLSPDPVEYSAMVASMRSGSLMPL